MGAREDVSGPLAAQLLREQGLDVAEITVVPDEVDAIRQAITQAALDGDLVVTTGGTGIAPRDVTPEATSPLLDYEIPGIAQAIRDRGESHAPAAQLSRGLVGVMRRGDRRVVVVNAPGSPSGVEDAVAVCGPLLPHIFAQLRGHDH